MTYGLSTRLFIENGPELTARQAQRRSSAAAHQLVWRKLPPAERIDLVDRFLKAA
jgi:hypothetical protein